MAQSAARVLGNYRMDTRKIRGEDSIFPLSTGYGNKTEYASIAQAAERILGKDEVSSSNLDRSSKLWHFLTLS